MKYILMIFIKAYQYAISPFFASSCRFYPSCSEYSLQSISKHGAFKGTWYSVKRIGKCHPFHPGGYDPVK